jgi:RNA polymerase sigma-70 factor, ECF subfamily
LNDLTKRSNGTIRDEIAAMLPRLRRFCLVLTGTPADADDLAQTTIERALSRSDQWQTGTRLDSWMYRIAQNANIDLARSRGRRGVHVGTEELTQLAGSDGRAITETRSALNKARDAIACLPDEQRVLIALVVLDGQSYREAAGILDIPIGTVMSRIARARAAIDAQVNGAARREDRA